LAVSSLLLFGHVELRIISLPLNLYWSMVG
jgi:hypothetical protein